VRIALQLKERSGGSLSNLAPTHVSAETFFLTASRTGVRRHSPIDAGKVAHRGPWIALNHEGDHHSIAHRGRFLVERLRNSEPCLRRAIPRKEIARARQRREVARFQKGAFTQFRARVNTFDCRATQTPICVIDEAVVERSYSELASS
jgi:hypothetical protein